MDLRRKEQARLAASIETERTPRRPGSWALPRLAAVGVAAFALAAVSAAYLHQRDLARQEGQQKEHLQQAQHELQSRSAAMAATLQAEIAGLQASDADRVSTIEALTEINEAMAARLAASERRLRALAAERDRALGAVEALEEEVEARERRLQSVLEEGTGLAEELAQTQARLIEISDQHEASQRTEAGLRWRLASIQTQLERLGARQAMAQSWLEGWVLGNLETLEDLVAGTGVDVDILVARAVHEGVGQGGPFEAMIDQVPEEAPLAAGVTDHLMRLSALQKLTSTLPLGAPLDHFHITSAYGKRNDPFNKGLAFHSGLDLGAPRGSQVLSTAPGTVLTAGRAGPYGNLVEIDHGMGVITRYGHLKSVEVEAGDQVGFRQPIGVIGNTGRSTSRHLHYEIRVDGAPYDPSRFLEAGRYLVAIFDLGELGLPGRGGG